MRQNPAKFLVLAGFLTLLSGLFACSPPRDGGEMLEPDEPPRMRQSPCEKGSRRCSTVLGGVEECDGRRWINVESCDESGTICRSGSCVSACSDLPNGSVGCSFYPANLWSTSDVGQLGIVASNTSSAISAQVTLADANGDIETKTAPPGGLVVFRIDHFRNKMAKSELAKKGFHLRSSAPVAAYLFHPIDAAQVFSGSATLLLPEHVMAQNYFGVAYTYNADLSTNPPQGQGVVAVVGIKDNTEVEVEVPVATAGGPGVMALAAGEKLKVTINRFDVLEIMQQNSRQDISGAVVKASEPVVVYGGAGAVSIPLTAIGGNHLGVQMFPQQTWGKHFAAAKFKQRNATDRDYYRILASVDMTHVSFIGGGPLPAPQTLMRRGFYEFDTDADFEIEADQPIMVSQYMPAWGNLSGTFDPAEFPDGSPPNCPFGGNSVQCLGDANMAPLAPIEQYRSDYIFYVPETYAYNYVNVTAPLDTAFMLDGNAVTEGLRPIVGSMLGRMILRVKPGNHRISGHKPFGLMSYGYAYATSYSYPGGLKLETINPIPPG